MTKQIEEKKHHWLVAAQLTFVIPDNKDGQEGAVIVQNTMLLTEEKQVTFRDLGRAQSALFQNLNDRFGQVVDVRDIVFLNVSYLGHMSQPDFQQNLVTKDTAAKKAKLKAVE
ncbi:gp40 [Escherichia phage N4]|uniref:Gp40 n=5 Tax=Enquatrovirus N4 TaxID=10752 RepID=A0MZD0_BPN4|nr:gp40 [Escherichia phage N4]AUV59044.1 hypothetical protein [Escherichia phage PMBT57]AYR04224.1 hypothetical protein [Escherichia phage OLB145]QDF14938.1 hypothetical protein AC3HA13_400 [Escherichia phage vB_EcoP_3HA13]QPN96309.1 hypothetical protein vec25_43 [Escherichia phage VEc25]QXV75806.1 hypothetical protein bas69_0038 [Escherichia phage AlfredRasser]CAE6410004.1 gp40 [Escherichia phage vB_Eco_Jura]CAH0462286.1 gp40 [Escherichia phage N4] [Escherichia phage vB_Eco_SPSP]CAH6421860